MWLTRSAEEEEDVEAEEANSEGPRAAGRVEHGQGLCTAAAAEISTELD